MSNKYNNIFSKSFYESSIQFNNKYPGVHSVLIIKAIIGSVFICFINFLYSAMANWSLNSLEKILEHIYFGYILSA